MAEEHQGASPFKLPRLSSNLAAVDDGAGVVTMAAAPPPQLMLGLGLGVGDGKASFTFMQMQELQHQALIYKYLTAGVPVPLHLVLPIWKSIAASTAGPHRFPTLMGWGSLCLDYRNSTEPEPGRCRRTDGKKWRCSKDVVPDHKYCDRHIHRGRNRSRKPVEATAAPPLAIAVPNAGGLRLMAAITNTKSSSGSNGSSNHESPTRLGFSPSSVLAGGETSKNVAS